MTKRPSLTAAMICCVGKRTYWAVVLSAMAGGNLWTAVNLSRSPSTLSVALTLIAMGSTCWCALSARGNLAYSRALTKALEAEGHAKAEAEQVARLRDRSHQLRAQLLTDLDSFKAAQIRTKVMISDLLRQRIEEERLLVAIDVQIATARTAIAEARGAVVAADDASEQVPEVIVSRWIRNTGMPALSGGLTAVALILVGRRREAMRTQWQTHLAGAPEAGIVVTPRDGVRYATGFLLAGIRLRIHDLTSPLWRPVDWIITSTSRTNTIITTAVGALIIYIQWHDGLHTLLTEGWGWCGACGVGLHMLARWVRRIRGIELARPESAGE